MRGQIASRIYFEKIITRRLEVRILSRFARSEIGIAPGWEKNSAIHLPLFLTNSYLYRKGGCFMREELKSYLFSKHILVSESEKDNSSSFDALFALANKLGINITKGRELANLKVFEFAAYQMRIYVPDPFYLGFPKTVKELTTEELLFDQLLSYFNTYYLGNFIDGDHSRFEKDFERIAFREEVTPKNFAILNEENAVKELFAIADNLLTSTRPLNTVQFNFLTAVIKDYDYEIKNCASKAVGAKLIAITENLEIAKFLNLSDTIKVIEEINHIFYLNDNIKKLNFENQHRKLISKIIDMNVASERADIITCYEKKALWAGILHHIHYKPKSKAGEGFAVSRFLK